MTDGVAVVDVFAGIGGLGLGAEQAGARLKLSVEIDPVCCETLKSNLPRSESSVLQKDVAAMTGEEIRSESGLGDQDSLVIVGGAPCQPFSKAAYWTDIGADARYREARAKGESATRPSPITTPKVDQRRTLIEEFQRLVVESKADGFVFENVPSILHPRNRETFLSFRAQFETSGYKTTMCKLNAAAFGVPQTRERVFLVGHKKRHPEAPSPTHYLDGKRKKGLRKAVTAGRALRPFGAKKYAEPEEHVDGKWADHLREIPPGWNYKALTEWAGHPNPSFIAERRFWNFLLKLAPDRPSWTIAANPGPWTGPFHWDSRRLRTPELAVLQSFPGSYRVKGSRRERVRQIGNAVPPLLAKNVVANLLSLF